MKTYERKCCRCQRYFEAESSRAFVCPDCKKLAEQRKKARKAEEYRAPKKPQARPGADIPLDKLISLLEKYNREHGTQLTYGQFVQHIADGSIKI